MTTETERDQGQTGHRTQLDSQRNKSTARDFSDARRTLGGLAECLAQIKRTKDSEHMIDFGVERAEEQVDQLREILNEIETAQTEESR